MLIEDYIVRTILQKPKASEVLAHVNAAYPIIFRALQITERVVAKIMLF